MSLFAALPASADINQLVAGMLASGSAPFSVDDASASDNNIRTFDYATYRFGFSVTPTDPQALMKLSVGSFTLPGSYVGPALNQVAFFDAKDLPTGAGGCQNVSLVALTTAQITAGGTSGVTADGQTLYCVQPANVGGNNLNFRLQILGNVPNGTTVNAPAFEFSSSTNPATTSLTNVLTGLVGSETFYGLSPLTVALAGVAAFLGHLFPVFFSFKGGKGVATLIGVIFGYDWRLGCGFVVSWLVVAAWSRYSSLAALCAAALTPVFVLALQLPHPYVGAALVMVAAVFWRHRENIHRLRAGTEGRIGARRA